MAMIVISTQIQENYGAHDWDGTGACPQYWKFKGGHEHKILNVDVNRAQEIVDAVAGSIEEDNDYFREYILEWTVESDSYLSEFERSQLEYDGRIDYPEPSRDFSTLALA
jgi:hypothetical protein